ncbi:uncharacterized protein LOC124165712 isoform X2 [Ischnura elegans]|nr:uncharacterized protein LOC124165712 isoform X2 [Ischnura elegans]
MVPVQNCCLLFNLRQGTILIGMVQLLLSAFGLFLLVLGISHAREMTSLLASDMEEQDGNGVPHVFATQWGDAAFRHGAHYDEVDEEIKTNEVGLEWKGQQNVHPRPPPPEEKTVAIMESSPTHMHYDNMRHFYYDSHGAIIKSISNQGQLHRAEHLAMLVIISMYTAVALVSIHLVSCILLLYSTYTRIRQLMLPWLSIVLMGLAFFLTAIFIIAFFGPARRATSIFAIGILLLMFGFYLWLVVFSYYRQLFENEIFSSRRASNMEGTVIPNGLGSNTVVVLSHPPGHHQQLRGWPWGMQEVTTTIPTNGVNPLAGVIQIVPNSNGKLYNV